MATQVPMATPGLLRQPMPYVNLGLLAPQGQAQRLQAPAPSLGQAPDALGGLGEGAQALGQNLMQMAQAQREADLQAKRSRLLGFQTQAAQLDLDQKELEKAQQEAARGYAANYANMLSEVSPRTKQLGAAVGNGATMARDARDNALGGPRIDPAPLEQLTAQPLPPPGLDPLAQEAFSQEALGMGLDVAPASPGDAQPAAPLAVDRLAAAPQQLTMTTETGDVVPFGETEQAADVSSVAPEVRPLQQAFNGLTPEERRQFAIRFENAQFASDPQAVVDGILKDMAKTIDIADASKLYRDTVKDFNSKSTKFEDKQDAFRTLGRELEQNTGAGDIAALKLFVQTFEAGVVQAGEQTLVLGSTSLQEQVDALSQKAMTGTLFTPEQRKKFYAAAAAAYETAKIRQQRLEESFKPAFKVVSARDPAYAFRSAIQEPEAYRPVESWWLGMTGANSEEEMTALAVQRGMTPADAQEMMNSISLETFLRLPQDVRDAISGLQDSYIAGQKALNQARQKGRG
jgi:hypothetical protein